MSRRKEKKQVETLAWITDDEAEFWTSITPNKADRAREFDASASKAKKYASDTDLPDGHHFKFDHATKKPVKSSYLLPNEFNQRNNQIQEENPKEVEEENVPQKQEQAKEISPEPTKIDSRAAKLSDSSGPSNEDSFLARLAKELMGLSEEQLHERFSPQPNEDYEQINSNDILHSANKPATSAEVDVDSGKAVDKTHSFLDEITEESFVIAGALDEDTLVNRRSQRAKSIYPVNSHPHRFLHQNTV